jgi:hypothetical protein
MGKQPQRPDRLKPVVWQDGPKGWRWTTGDGRFDSQLYATKREAQAAADASRR